MILLLGFIIAGVLVVGVVAAFLLYVSVLSDLHGGSDYHGAGGDAGFRVLGGLPGTGIQAQRGRGLLSTAAPREQAPIRI